MTGLYVLYATTDRALVDQNPNLYDRILLPGNRELYLRSEVSSRPSEARAILDADPRNGEVFAGAFQI